MIREEGLDDCCITEDERARKDEKKRADVSIVSAIQLEGPDECYITQDEDKGKDGKKRTDDNRISKTQESSSHHYLALPRRLFRILPVCGGVWPTLKAVYESRCGNMSASKAASRGRHGLLWWHGLESCYAGDLSIGVAQANNLLEDHCCLQLCPTFGTVIGVFDGHGGPEAARFISNHLFHYLTENASGPQGVTVDAIWKAFEATEEGFIALVSQLWETKPQIATVGSCCLVGVVHQRTLFIANLGESRAVLGKVDCTKLIAAEQLSSEHSASHEGVRRELMAEHPDDPHIVVLRHNVWRVKGIIQVSRSIGDAYLKNPQYNREPIHSKFRVSEPFSRPLLSANPSIVSRSLQPSDCFIIFASDGLWEHLNNQKAVEIVHNGQRAGSAGRLIKAALQQAMGKREMRYSHLKKIDRGVRRHFDDDITVIVLFIDHDRVVQDHAQGQPFTIRYP